MPLDEELNDIHQPSDGESSTGSEASTGSEICVGDLFDHDGKQYTVRDINDLNVVAEDTSSIVATFPDKLYVWTKIKDKLG